MLADLRFVLGAVLAVTLLAVMGLGVVTSVALMREAHVRPIEDSRSLAYAGPLGRNEFYDPDGTWRSAPAGAPATQIETPAAVAPAEAPEQIASIPPNPPAVETAPVVAEEREAATETVVTAPPSPPPLETETPPEAPPAAEPASGERLASASAAPPADDPPRPSPASPEASVATLEAEPPPEVSSAGLPPMPRPRPQPRKQIARAHVRRAPAAATQSAPDPTAIWAPWPFFGQPPAAASAANKSSQPGAPYASRPQ
jgi:hypothetical protein